YDSVPLVCFTGQVPIGLIGNTSFQEVDIVNITESICKYAVMVHNREELAETIRKAFYIARTGKPGVVVVDLPKDIQKEYGSDSYSKKREVRDCDVSAVTQMGQISKALEVLNQAKKPLFLVGGGVNIAHANREMTQLAEKTGVPVVTTIMGKGGIPSTHELYVGNLGIHGSFAANSAVSHCDVLFSIGTRFSDRITGKTEEFAKNATIIHMDIDPSSISRDVVVNISVAADAKEVMNLLLKHTISLQVTEWLEKIRQWKKEYPLVMDNVGMSPQKIMQAINETFPKAVISTDVGQNQMWAAQFLELDENKKLLTSGGMGTMGYGFPAAIGAKLGNPEKDVLVLTGDGGMQMNIQEMATAVAYELPIVICILNNGYLGNVRQWQEMFYERCYSSTCMRYRKSCPVPCDFSGKDCPEYTPDFVKLAESYGAKGIRVMNEKEIVNALTYGRKNKKVPTVIEFIIEAECNVMPIVPLGNSLEEMILENKGNCRG
ncbi:MAG: biosynthetic-type acetolactate synthase large subunit, partial [Lachnospiraceae bacterium]|nr:biosynthetic-type acetolactate synthase large subunit [Lachnospiraceae bacterium]